MPAAPPPLARPHALALATTLALGACPLPTPPDLGASTALAPIAVGPTLVLPEPDGAHLLALDLADGRLVASRRLPLSGPPSLLGAVPSAPVVAALSSTHRTLDLLAVDGSEHRTLHLGAPFEGLALSPDGTHAIAYHPPGTAHAVFHNDNEIALVDLSAPADLAVTRKTLPSLGGAPLSVHISPPAGARRYAFVLSAEHVAITSLDAPQRAERSVPLVSLTTGGNRTPTGVVFAVDPLSSTLWAIVSTREASSVYALAVRPSPGAAPDAPDFDVALTQLAGITPGGAATLVARTDTLYTLTTSPSAGTVTLTDLATATGRTLALTPGLDRIHLFSGPDLTPMALVWSSAHGTTFHVVDLDRLASGANKAFETRTSHHAFTELLPIPATSAFIALHPSDDEGVSVIDAATSRITGFGKTGRVVSLALSEPLGRLFLLTAHAGDAFIVSVDLATLHPEVALAPEGADAFAVLPEAATLAAFADRQGGLVTLWPALAAADDTTLVLSAFLLDGLFQR